MTWPRWIESTKGASFSEVLVAMALMMIGLASAMGAFAAAERSLGHNALKTRALAMAQSRLEAKRSVRWEQLLMDDLDHDGVAEIIMNDNGDGGDRIAGDNIYSAQWEHGGILMNWTVAPQRGAQLSVSGLAVLEVRASFQSSSGEHEIRLATIRANPAFVGSN
jgi:hypothetical protein